MSWVRLTLPIELRLFTLTGASEETADFIAETKAEWLLLM